MDFDSRLAQSQALVNPALEQRGPNVGAGLVSARYKATGQKGSRFTSDAPDCLALATEYALSGGKRLRPYVVFSVAEMLGRDPHEFMGAACAVECIHTSSLILDDLPCMDDSPTRRGRPSLHCEFGEAMAILTAVSLLSRGFAHVGENAAALGSSSDVTERALTCLAQTVGTNGMASGQMAELLASAPTDLYTLEHVNDRKTSLLFVASAELPAILAGAGEQDEQAVGGYAHDLGLAYQITDDILDVPTADAHKKTIATLLGREQAAAKAGAHIDAALAAIRTYGESAEALRLLGDYVLARVR